MIEPTYGLYVFETTMITSVVVESRMVDSLELGA